MNEAEAYRLLCDCRYYGMMTGGGVAKRLRHHAKSKELRLRVKQAVGRFFGLTA